MGVHPWRMARVRITVADDRLERARTAGLNVSQTAAEALADELERRAKIADLDRLLAEWSAELGSLSDDERDEARAWVDRALPEPTDGEHPRSA
jgi:post-segregation antitoxin (ccd killing protein)